MNRPAARNNRRYDLSDRLIHFFRDINILSDDAPATPEHWGYSSIPEDVEMPAFFLLRHAIRQGRLWATWSYRGEERTIYGPRPAVCFTEMPIAAFVEASRARKAMGQAISSYALVFPKRALFADGARPVIYGLSVPAMAYRDSLTGERRFSEDVLPLREQYRHVAFDPLSGRLDWTHEREWRWPSNEAPIIDLDGIPPGDSNALPGLELDVQTMRGIGVIVSTTEEADRVAHDILTKVDRGDLSENHYQFILAANAIPNWSALRDPSEIEDAIHDNIVDLAPYFICSRDEAEQIAAKIDRIAQDVETHTTKSSDGYCSERGGCWLWLRNNRHSIVRALIRLGRAVVNGEGRYLVHLPSIDPSRPLRQRQEMINEVAARLDHDYAVPGNYFAVLNSWNPNKIPSYHNDYLADEFFYNFNYKP
ncbi:DUF4427 domain-containing protein [Komagataeibacter oboediens]|uniref:DUF4427 domain-containing protein n=1 Tax=Komagataeibacter oboediens TaxID=65958 RepID=UPI000237E3D6|nr:DUF4427 domain-containing protein [Komagataeibacter oboediens]